MATAPPVPDPLSAADSPAQAGSAGPPRLGWLDALRGLAALLVAVEHSSYSFMAQTRELLTPQLNIGRYGVMLFFLVSGYVIPASLERRGRVRTFWVGRAFRIYPLWAAVVGSALVLDLLGVTRLGTRFAGQDPVTVVVAHVTLLQELLGTPSVVRVLWTLSYELAFYLLVVALFTVRPDRRPAKVSVVLAVAAAVSAAVGFVPRASALSRAVGTGPLVALVTVALVIAVLGAGCRSSAPRFLGAVTGGVLALVLVAFNGTVPPWEGLVILAVMFLGAAVRRAESGRGTWPSTARSAVVVLICAVGTAYGQGGATGFARRGWITAFLLAALTFGAALALRSRRFPRVLTRLGTISYSVYLVHPVLLAVSDGVLGRYRQDRPVLEAAFFAVLLPLSALTYRLIELPALVRGRKRTDRTDRIDGIDRIDGMSPT
ncbi:acyltransferase family protein [Streptomyces aureus]